MFKKTKVCTGVLLALGGGIVAVSPALAQQAAERVEITGSRLKSSDVDTASPVVSIGAEQIKVEGVRSVEQLLNNLPQVFADYGGSVSNGATGTATVNLRNIGRDRTLVLVNGRRLPAGSPRALAADLNQIPVPLIKRVEVLTGGASAVYGSDAVAGVVNFIMNDRFEGVQFEANHSFYNHQQGNAVASVVRARNFPVPGDKSADGTEFANLDEPKLVGYCRNTPQYEQYNLQEAQLYRVYRQVTDLSHKVRVLRISYADSASGQVETTRYGFIIEDPAQMAARVGGKILDRKGATADDLDPTATAMAYTYLYFMANTDVSFNGLHNGEIVSLPNGQYAPVAYDFDFAGIINAHYAGTDPSLPIRNVRTRLFRGYCAHEAAYPPIYEIFKEKRPAIEALYADTIGKLIAPGTVKNSLDYINDFYKDIRTPEAAKKALMSDCLK